MPPFFKNNSKTRLIQFRQITWTDARENDGKDARIFNNPSKPTANLRMKFNIASSSMPSSSKREEVQSNASKI